MTKPIATFRVKPEQDRRFYFQVYVWQWLKDMRAHLAKIYDRELDRGGRAYYADAHAATIVHDDKRLEVAEIHLCSRHLSPYLISHEALHACIGWAARVGIDLGEIDEDAQSVETEERLCYAVGEVAQVILDQVRA